MYIYRQRDIRVSLSLSRSRSLSHSYMYMYIYIYICISAHKYVQMDISQLPSGGYQPTAIKCQNYAQEACVRFATSCAEATVCTVVSYETRPETKRY